MVILDIPFRDNSLATVHLDDYGVIVAGRDKVALENSISRPIKSTELFAKLRHKGWGKFDGRFITEYPELNDQQNLMYRVYIPEGPDIDFPESDVDVISTGYRVNGEIKLSPCFKMYSPQESTGGGLKEEVDSLFKEIFGYEYIMKDIVFSNSSREVVDLLDNTISFSIISPDSDTYTNTIGLGELINYSSMPGISAKIDLTIQYSIGEDIYNRDINFTAFKYNPKGELEIESLQFDLDSDVSVFFIAETGVIEAYPQEGSEVGECIINSCVVSYGKS